MQHSLRTLSGCSSQSFHIPSDAVRNEAADKVAKSIQDLKEKLERDEYRTKQQRQEDEMQLAKNISYLEQIHKYKRSVDHCKKQLDRNDYETSRARQKDVEKLSRSASGIAVMMLCSEQRAKAASVLKGKSDLKFLR